MVSREGGYKNCAVNLPFIMDGKLMAVGAEAEMAIGKDEEEKKLKTFMEDIKDG